MTILQSVLLLLGICAGLFLVCLAALWWERNWQSDRYDERQQIARNKSYRLAFWLGFLYYLVAAYIMLFQVEGEKTIEPYLLLFFGLMFQLLVAHIYDVLTGSALPFSKKPGWMVLSYLFTGSAQVICFRIWDKRYPTGMSLTGPGSAKWIYMTLAVFFYLLAVLYLIYALKKEKED